MKVLLFLFCVTGIALSAVTKKCDPNSCPIKCCNQKKVCAKVVAECIEFGACRADLDCNHTSLSCNKDRCSLKANAFLSEFEFILTRSDIDQMDEPLKLAETDAVSNLTSSPLTLPSDIANTGAQDNVQQTDSAIMTNEDTNQINLVLKKNKTTNPVLNSTSVFKNHSQKVSGPAKSANATFNVTDPQRIVSRWVFDKEKKVFVWTFFNKETNETKTFETNSSSLSFIPKAPSTNTSQFFRNQSSSHSHHNINKSDSKDSERHRHHQDKRKKDQRKGNQDFEDEEFYQRNGSDSKHHEHGHHGKHHGDHDHHHKHRGGDHHHGKHHGGHHHEHHGHHGHHGHHEGGHHGHHGHQGHHGHHQHHGYHGHHRHHRASFLLWALLSVILAGAAIFVIYRYCKKVGRSERMERIAQRSARLLNRVARRRDNKVTAEMTPITAANTRTESIPSEIQTRANPTQVTEKSTELYQNEIPSMNPHPQAIQMPFDSYYQALPQTHPQFMHYQVPVYQPAPQHYAPQYYPMQFPQNMQPRVPRHSKAIPNEDNNRNNKRTNNKVINLEL